MVLDCWFLKSLFAVFFVIYCCGFISSKIIRVLVLSLVFILHAFCIPDLWSISYSMPFVLFGNYLRNVYDKFDTNVMYIVTLLGVLLMSIFWKSDYLIYFTPYTLSVTGVCFNLFRIIYAISVSLLILLSLKRLIPYMPSCILQSLTSVGRNTLLIYILQFFVVERVLCYISYSTESWIVDNFIIVPILSLLFISIFHKIGKFLSNNAVTSNILQLRR